MEKIDEEVAELAEAEAAHDREAVADEFGDLLFTMANLARHLKVDPEEALVRANRKFEGRFRQMEANLKADGSQMETLSIGALEAAWQQAKRELG